MRRTEGSGPDTCLRLQLAASCQALGAAIAHMRGHRTQAEVAAKAGLSRASWSLYETGKRLPGRANFGKVLRALNTTQERLEELAWTFRRRRKLPEGTLKSGVIHPESRGEALDPLIVVLERIALALENGNSRR